MRSSSGERKGTELDRGELEAFCNATYPRIVGSLSLMCGNAHMAEELAQDAYARLCRDWWRVRRMDHPQAWLYRVAVNLGNSRFRRSAAERRAREHLDSAPSEEREPDTATQVAVRRAVASLPSRQRTSLVLRYYVDMPYAQIAELMGTKESTAKSHVAKALQNMRSHELVDPEVEHAILDH